MKRVVLSLIIVFVFTSTALAQEIRPSGIWLNLLFPEVREYMDNMQEQINRMEEKLDKYMEYQHNMNNAMFWASTASFGIAAADGFYISGQYSIGDDSWDQAVQFLNDAELFYEDAIDLAEDLDID